MSTINYAARARAFAKSRRERRVDEARSRVDAFREEHPRPQLDMELADPPYSRREHLEAVRRDALATLALGVSQ